MESLPKKSSAKTSIHIEFTMSWICSSPRMQSWQIKGLIDVKVAVPNPKNGSRHPGGDIGSILGGPAGAFFYPSYSHHTVDG